MLSSHCHVPFHLGRDRHSECVWVTTVLLPHFHSERIIFHINVRKHTHCFESTHLNEWVWWCTYPAIVQAGITHGTLQSLLILLSVHPIIQQAFSGHCINWLPLGYNVGRNKLQTSVANNQMLISSSYYVLVAGQQWLSSCSKECFGFWDPG